MCKRYESAIRHRKTFLICKTETQSITPQTNTYITQPTQFKPQFTLLELLKQLHYFAQFYILKAHCLSKKVSFGCQITSRLQALELGIADSTKIQLLKYMHNQIPPLIHCLDSTIKNLSMKSTCRTYQPLHHYSCKERS